MSAETVQDETGSNEINDKEMPLLEHLAELRRRLIWAGVTFILAFGVCYYFSARLYDFLAAPLAHAMQAQGEKPELIYTALFEAFFTYVKIAAFAAAFVSFPMVAGQLWLFVAPGLYKKEKRALLPFLIVTPILFFAGGAAAYYIFFPMMFKFNLAFQHLTPGTQDVQIVLLPKVSDYLSTTMKVIFAFGLSFELPVLLTLLGKVGIVNSASLKKYRRYAYVGCVVVAGVLAPPDAMSMCLMGAMLVVLFEISLFAVKMVEPKAEPENA